MCFGFYTFTINYILYMYPAHTNTHTHTPIHTLIHSHTLSHTQPTTESKLEQLAVPSCMTDVSMSAACPSLSAHLYPFHDFRTICPNVPTCTFAHVNTSIHYRLCLGYLSLTVERSHDQDILYEKRLIPGACLPFRRVSPQPSP